MANNPFPKKVSPVVKWGLIGLGGVLVIGAVTIGILYFTQGNPTPAAPPETQTPDKVVTSPPDPTKDTCTIVDAETIRSQLGETTTDTQKRVTTAANGEPADGCYYTFSTEKSTNNTFSVQRYLYKPGVGDTEAEQTVSLDWYNIDKTLYPTYFIDNEKEATDTRTFTMRVINGPSNYLFIINQPADAATFTMQSAIDTLRTIANEAKY